jgi:hypothetical protein
VIDTEWKTKSLWTVGISNEYPPTSCEVTRFKDLIDFIEASFEEYNPQRFIVVIQLKRAESLDPALNLGRLMLLIEFLSPVSCNCD